MYVTYLFPMPSPNAYFLFSLLAEQVKAEKEIISMPKGPEEYRPPVIRQYRTETDVPPAMVKDFLDISDFPKGELRSAWINMVCTSLSQILLRVCNLCYVAL